jgi:hypothetical protein
MPIFRESLFKADCDACGTRFSPGSGGVCVRCKRILCSYHLHGSIMRRLRVAYGAESLCVNCRRKADEGASATAEHAGGRG